MCKTPLDNALVLVNYHYFVTIIIIYASKSGLGLWSGVVKHVFLLTSNTSLPRQFPIEVRHFLLKEWIYYGPSNRYSAFFIHITSDGCSTRSVLWL